jgi:tRNA A37 N6-isopentenylltransferase MiaA
LHDRGIYATRQLAKRQLTWLRATEAEAFDPLVRGFERAVGDRLVHLIDRR